MAAVDKAALQFADEVGWGLFPMGKNSGEPIRVDQYTPGVVGVYEVTIHSQPTPAVLPRRGEETLNWSPLDEFKTQATHCDIELIRGGGGRVTVHSGLIWRHSSRDLFKPFIIPLAEKKDEQDSLKGKPGYNPALRELYKLLMNSASGKCAQKNYDDMTEIATGSKAQLAAENKMRAGTVEWIPIGGETCILIGKKPEKQVYNSKYAKPSILSVLIYSYSRALLWKTLLQHNCIYSDTDSGVFRVTDYERIRATLPALDPTGRKKSLGDLEEELGPHHTARGYFIAPKDYAVFLFDAEGKPLLKKSKLRMKGVNQRTDRIIHVTADITKLSIIERGDEYNAPATEITTPLSENPELFFSRRANSEEISVLCSQLTRSYKDSDSPFALVQRFLVKTFIPTSAGEAKIYDEQLFAGEE
jgi:hypothetical protein